MSLNAKRISVRKENLIKCIDKLPDKAKSCIYGKLQSSDNLRELDEGTHDKETVGGFELIHLLYILFLTELQEKVEERKNRPLTEEECFELSLFIAGKYVSDISKAFELLSKEEKLILESFRRGGKLADLQQFRTFRGRSLEELSEGFFRAKANFVNYFGLISDLGFKDDQRIAEIMSIVVDGFAEDEFPADPLLLKLLGFVVRPAEDDENRTKIREKIKLFLAYTYADSIVRIDDLEADYGEMLIAIESLIKEKNVHCELPEICEERVETGNRQDDPVLEFAKFHRMKRVFKGEIRERLSAKFSRNLNEATYKLEKMLVKVFRVERLKARFRIRQGENLIAASFVGDLLKVKQLIDDGADINFLGKHRNPLHAAIQSEEAGMLEYLIERGADINFFCKGYSPLHAAIREEARYLIHAELLDEEDKDPPQPVLTEILVRAGANVNSFSPKCGTPLNLAKNMEHKLAVDLLELHSSIN